MTADNLPDLSLFVAVATHRSFARAAALRGVSRSAVSHAIRDLEERLGVRLFHRTTRSVMPTEAGAALLISLEPALAMIDQALSGIDAFRSEPRGMLRLNIPRGAAALLEKVLCEFAGRYPEIQVEVTTNDAFVDTVREGFDAGVRFGESLAQDMIALPFGPQQRFAVVASPTYFERFAAPQAPDDLTGHNCIGRRFPSGVAHQWEFEKDGRELSVSVSGQLSFDDGQMILAAARAGLGIAQVFEAEAAADLAAGRLVRALVDWCPPFPGYHLYYSGRRQLPAPLAAFVDCVRSFRDW